MRKHQELRAWQLSMQLVEDIYKITKDFPSDERFGLTDQIRRAAVSVPSNIAEGAARGSDKDFLRFLYIARGSHSEVNTQLEIASRLGYTKDMDNLNQSIEQAFAQLGGLIRHMEAKK